MSKSEDFSLRTFFPRYKKVVISGRPDGYKFNDPMRAKLDEYTTSTSAPLSPVVGSMNIALDQSGVPLTVRSYNVLSENLKALDRREYGHTLGHAKEVVNFSKSVGSAISSRWTDPGEKVPTVNTEGLVVSLLGVVMNSLGAMGAAAVESNARKIGKDTPYSAK